MAVSALCTTGEGDDLRGISGNGQDLRALLYDGVCLYRKELF